MQTAGRDYLQQFHEGGLKQRWEEEGGFRAVLLKDHRALDGPLREEIERKPEAGRAFGAD